ncbi:BlaI/MecI/CopY family transcriptional regulator [Homoserinibacter sp. GY 40078]|uniref:BlaI/MecI/CopY family transcriptional regulator n=1 Tax=Homoserinibacter sp. GY 40078 TaxID=2603275 RepID=UPI0011C95CD8|nr:BlaI/MecI/CopY family transcriptional regulator [Homoserinibacter sp. GY 40078]TXK18971.1 BlaI/MecI/CopY family transcriptional regulator [Homoserinibacter sp. GY 40078]
MAGIRTRAKGELEGEILRVLRSHEAPASAAEIQDAVPGIRPALTTVLTALERLVEKGEVLRFAESPRRVRFQAALSEVENASELMRGALVGVDRRAALLQFAGDLADDDVAFLRDALTRRGKR